MSLTAYRTPGWTPAWTLEPAPVTRTWMDISAAKLAYRCLPMTIANTSGWVIRCPATFVAQWGGEPERASLQTAFHEDYAHYTHAIHSHFGGGVLTFQIPYLFITNANISLSVRGLPNYIKHGAHPLEGIVETAWAYETFTMNWMLEKYTAVLFEVGDPICFIQPIDITPLPHVTPRTAALESNPTLNTRFKEWKRDRHRFNADPARTSQEWQKTYTVAAEIKALKLAPFVEEPPDESPPS